MSTYDITEEAGSLVADLVNQPFSAADARALVERRLRDAHAAGQAAMRERAADMARRLAEQSQHRPDVAYALATLADDIRTLEVGYDA